MSLATDMRLLADFMEKNPGLDNGLTFNQYLIFVDTKEEMAKVAKRYGPLVKDYGTDDENAWFSLSKRFGETLQIQWTIRRAKVCELVTVGKETVKRPKMVQDGEEEVEVEKKEWRCTESLLGAAARR